ncbi:hypothetical protein LTR36_010599 [Oleoguttula mirabilis]|uniref:Uncharacterized protein n=1 Tax=Oleoguttula mirabilis TaxID=1507867 RepID=A0AAV9JR12_9PEZI|nr:hypothetical protein LTR36_010599 [Oleoguttula mirabilis]
MPWRPLPSVAFAICTYPFRATDPDDLPLQIGDCLYIIEQGGSNGDWYRGYLVGFPSLLAGLTSARGEQLDARVFTGIFPRNCVEVREVMDDAKYDGTAGSARRDETAEDGEEAREKRKSQVQYARRLSRALSRKRSAGDVAKRPRPRLIPDEPMPRHPNAPKPLAPVPLLRVGDETGHAEEPLVDEIASCLREWHDARLHALLLARGYSQLARVQDLIKRVDTSRKQLMHDVMTLKELSKLREDTVWDLVAGNKMLSEEVIVRSPTERGRILTADDSVIEMTRLQANMSILDRPPKAPVDRNMLYHVLVDVRNLVCEYEQPATLQIYLCSKDMGEKPRPLSENYAISVPMPEGPAQTPEDAPKSLFVNLSATDIGLGAETSALYVVFKLLKDEPVRQGLNGQAGIGHQPTMSMQSTNAQKNGSLRGRRGVFGSQRKKDNHNRTPSANRPTTATSDYSETGRSSELQLEGPPSRDTKMVKRTVGVGVIDIGKLARNQLELERRVALWAPVSPSEDRSDGSDDWTEVIRELMRSPTGGYNRVGMVKRFDVFATAFASSDLDSLVHHTPTLLHGVHMTQKISFTGAPTHKRSDIYFTLTEPLIPRNAQLAHSKFGNVPLSQRCQSNLANLQLTLEVRKADGERIDDCIFTASNHQGHTAWRTTGVERGEGWNQTLKLVIPTEDVPGSHIVMSIADSPNFPFALAWVPLWENEAFVRDGDHHVALYVYDEYSSSIIGGKGAYLALPPWCQKSEAASANAAVVSLRTFLCSTEYSQDPTLLGLLNWRKLYGAKLVELLEHFSFVPEIEIVKLLSDVFAALFEILHEYANSEAYEDLIFYNFVTVLSIARDRRFNLHEVIEEYATTRHDWPYASQCLVRAYQRLLTNPLDPDSSRKLRATLKVGDQMLKLIIETTRQPSEIAKAQTNGESHQRHPSFVQDLQNLFVALMALMRNPMAVLLGTQTLVVQHFHTWLPELAYFMTPMDILEIATNLLDACAHAQGKMILYRLILIINLSHLDIFKPAEIRTTLIANTFRWLAPYWGGVPVVTEQWRSQVRLCCSVVAAQMEELGEESCQYVPKLVESYAALQKAERKPKRTFSMLFPTSFPFPSKPTPMETDVDEAMLEMTALLAAALTTQTRLYFDASQVDIMGVLMQALKVGQSVLGCEAFPRSWVSLHVSHHRFAMSALERISEVLVDSLPDVFAPDAAEAYEFDTAIWRTFFDTLFAAVSSPALAMETFPEQKRRAIWKIAGDVRELGADLIRRTWDAIGWETDEDSKRLHGFDRMGGYQVQFVPELVAPIVELCLSVHASLRNVAVEVLRTMVISTWEIDQDLGVIQTAMIECLDKLCRAKAVTESYLQKTFIDEMLEQFRPLQHTMEDGLYNAVCDMFARIEDLLGMLANVHQGGAINEATKIVDTLRLMEFLRDVQSDEAYIRYVHQLTDLQSAAGHHTEAGLALRLHADRYEWDPSTILDEMAEPKMPAQTAFERKEGLYFEMCQLFEKGQSWQRALSAYRELGWQYEQNIFDFSKLARSQRAMASIHERIAKGDRVNPRYFRVIYKGLGFPSSLRDKEFIFEGQVSDRLANFEDRLQQLHPAAQIIRANVEPEVEGQYLQIFAVSPNKDLAHMVYQRTKVSQAAREHSLLSNPQKFTTTTRHPAHDVPITEQAVDKIIYTTAEPFPTILRRSEIVGTENVTLSPIQAAIERTTRKTQELQSLEKRISSGEDEGAMSRLSEDLLLSVDPNSDSSVARYRSLLPASEVPDTSSQEVDPVMLESEEEPVLDVMQHALKTALLDHALAIRRCLGLYNRSAYVATKAELVPRFEATFEHELAILFPQSAGLMHEPSPSATIHDQASTQHSVSIVEPHAAPGAQQQHADADDAPDDLAPRQGRRSSIPWLNRRTSSSNNNNNNNNNSGKQTNGHTDAANGDGSHSRQRSRSRLRDQSLTRRLSFFRNSEDRLRPQEASSAGGEAPSGMTGERSETQQATNYTAMSTAQLKKRLSFLRSSTAMSGGVTATGEFVQ